MFFSCVISTNNKILICEYEWKFLKNRNDYTYKETLLKLLDNTDLGEWFWAHVFIYLISISTNPQFENEENETEKS